MCSQIFEVEFERIGSIALNCVPCGIFILADANALTLDGYVGSAVLSPASSVVVLHAITHQAQSFMSVATEYAMSIPGSSMRKRATGDLGGESKPRGIETLKKTNHAFFSKSEFLQT